MRAYVFPGQASQFVGMGKELYATNIGAKKLFESANDILGFRITDIMFDGTDEALKQTNVTQPSVFIHSYVVARTAANGFFPDCVAGHSLGEFSALTAVNSLSFEDGLRLVSARATAMQKACEKIPGTMAAILGLSDEIIEEVCANIDDIVVPANYNTVGQLVISGTLSGVTEACRILKERGAKRALILPVGGAFHSPLMKPAEEELKSAIEKTHFNQPDCPIYQNVDAQSHINPEVIKQNLIKQLTSPVLWTKTMQNMLAHQVNHVFEVGGTGKVLRGMFGSIDKELVTEALM